MSHHEVDAGRIGIAAPILSADRRVLGSLSYIVPANTDERTIARLTSLLIASSRDIERVMQSELEDTKNVRRRRRLLSETTECITSSSSSAAAQLG